MVLEVLYFHYSNASICATSTYDVLLLCVIVITNKLVIFTCSSLFTNISKLKVRFSGKKNNFKTSRNVNDKELSRFPKNLIKLFHKIEVLYLVLRFIYFVLEDSYTETNIF